MLWLTFSLNYYFIYQAIVAMLNAIMDHGQRGQRLVVPGRDQEKWFPAQKQLRKQAAMDCHKHVVLLMMSTKEPNYVRKKQIDFLISFAL